MSRQQILLAVTLLLFAGLALAVYLAIEIGEATPVSILVIGTACGYTFGIARRDSSESG